MSFMTEATATLDYDTYDYTLPHTKTIDLIGEEFVKKEAVTAAAPSTTSSITPSGPPPQQLSSSSAPSYTTTTSLPQFSLPATSTEENGVLYCNLDDLSRYIPDNFTFDLNISENLECLVKADPDQIPAITTTSDLARVQVVSLPTQPLPAHLATTPPPGQFSSSRMTISLPTAPDPRYAPASSGLQISLKNNSVTSSTTPSNIQTFSFPTIDTTKLTGQLTVVQELPEVGKLVFQEIKTENDPIVNILEGMKNEEPLIPLDYTVNNSGDNNSGMTTNIAKKGVKRVVAPVQQVPPGAKRVKNVIVVQQQGGQHGGAQQVQYHHQPQYGGHSDPQHPVEAVKSQPDMFSQSSQVTTSTTAVRTVHHLDPPSPLDFSDDPLVAKSEAKQQQKLSAVSPKSSFINSKFNGNASVPSSKICNWIFENGQVCGKTFSKSYNLVVHMRMHEDIRPFACNHCDQTFRQKAHLQRHETTHGIQTKNFYRASPSSKKKKKKPPKTTANSKNLQNRLSRVSENLNRPLNRSPGESEDDTEADEILEDEEDDSYVPQRKTTTTSQPSRKYSDNDKDMEKREDQELDMHQLEVEVAKNLSERLGGGRVVEAQRQAQDGFHQVVKQEKPETAGLEILNLAHSRQHDEDDDNSTVQDIIQTVTNAGHQVEQKLDSSSLFNCENVLLNPERVNNNKPLPSIVSLSLAGSNTQFSLLPPPPSSHQFVQQPATTLYTTFPSACSTSLVSSPQSSLQSPAPSSCTPSTAIFSTFTSTPVTTKNQFVIENLEEHSPEIQAEILNALLADEGCMSTEPCQEVVIGLDRPVLRSRTRSRSLSSGPEDSSREEELYRDSALPPGWWVLKRRRVESNIWDNYYYSPEGYRFRGKFEIKKFLDEGVLPKGVKNPTRRFPPVPVEELPLRTEGYSPRKSSQSPSAAMPSILASPDANTLAQTLIANLKPEPIEHLQQALNCDTTTRIGPDSLSCLPAVVPLPSVS